MENIFKTLSLRARYAYVLHRIRNYPKGQKIRVMFLVNETSKWKCQSLYDAMEKSGRYEPFIVVTQADVDWYLPDDVRRKNYDATARFFAERKMRVEDGFDWNTRELKCLFDFHPDIVWYQQPYRYGETHRPDFAALEALTCYVPYYVPNYGDIEVDYGMIFHKCLWRYFIMDEEWRRLYRGKSHVWSHAGEMLGLGHTMLDNLPYPTDEIPSDGCVIYAPHWSIDHPKNENFENYSTFLWTAKPILEYAKAHRQIKWVFKPHPRLRFTLERTGAWSHEEIDDYYRDWATIGTVVQQGGYEALFAESRAMVTDCASFLTEYFTTGRPIVHLISPSAKLKPLKPSQAMFRSFYQVTNLDELCPTLDSVALHGDDPRRAERLELLRQSGIRSGSAAERILDYLDIVLRCN